MSTPMNTSTGWPRIGFVGLSAMGLGMARHLAAAGYPLSAYDIAATVRRRERAEIPGFPCRDRGRGGRGVGHRPRRCSLTAARRAGHLWRVWGCGRPETRRACCRRRPARPDAERRTAARLAELGIDMVDAPVSEMSKRLREDAELVLAWWAEKRRPLKAPNPCLAILGSPTSP